jgi:Tfp pilus assembly protein FimT
MHKQTFRSQRQSGFTIIQMVITVAIIAIVTTFGVLGITSARAQMRAQNSARRFAVYIEKARADSVRRHAGPGNLSSVQSSPQGSNTFVVTMDFDNSGVVRSRTMTLDTDIVFNTISQTVAFDWRGRINQRVVYQIGNMSVGNIPVDVSGSGDVTIDSQHFLDDDIPAVVISQVTGDQIPDPTPLPTSTPPSNSTNDNATPTPTPIGNGNGGGTNGNGNPHSTPTPTPTPVPTPVPNPTPAPTPDPNATPTPVPQCVNSVSPTTLTLSQSNSSRQTGYVYYTLSSLNGARTISAALVGNGNSLTFSVSPTTLTQGVATIAIGAKPGNGNRGIFLVNISANPACGTVKQVQVEVLN